MRGLRRRVLGRASVAALTLLLLLLLLGVVPMGSGVAAGQATPAGPEPLAEPVSLRLFTNVRSAEFGPPPADWVWYRAVKEALNIDVEVEFVTQTSEYVPQLQRRAAANDLPDLFLVTGFGAIAPRTTIGLLAEQGLLADWTPLLPSMPTFVAERGVAELAPIGTFDDARYGLVTRSSDPFKGLVALRQDWLTKLGLETPRTLDEYLAVMRAFTEQDPDGNGRDDTFGWSASVNSAGELSQLNPIFGAFGALGDWRVVDGDLTSVWTSPGRREALAFVRRMVEAGVMDPDWRAQTFEDFRIKWKSGRVGIFAEDWCATFCSQGYGEFAAANPTGELVLIEPPVGPTGQSAVGTRTLVGNQYAVSRRAVDEGKGEAIARLLEWINTAGYELTAHGPDFTRNATTGFIEQGSTPESIVRRQLTGWALKGDEAELRSRYSRVTDYPNGRSVDVYAIMERAQLLPYVDLTRFAVLPPPPTAQAADLARAIAEAEFGFASGQRPLSDEEWDAYAATLGALGLDEWTERARARAAEEGLLS